MSEILKLSGSNYDDILLEVILLLTATMCIHINYFTTSSLLFNRLSGVDKTALNPWLTDFEKITLSRCVALGFTARGRLQTEFFVHRIQAVPN